MKTIKILLLAIMAASVFSCSKDKDENTGPDFSILGVSSVTVNKVTYKVNDDLLWIIDGATPFYISATEMQTASKHYTVEYVVSSSDEIKDVSATSIYSNASINVSSDTTTTGIVYKVIQITRPNYDEQLTYKIYFADIEY